LKINYNGKKRRNYLFESDESVWGNKDYFQVQAPAALTTGKRLAVPFGYEAGWVPGPPLGVLEKRQVPYS
jgi:hypothetical protein